MLKLGKKLDFVIIFWVFFYILIFGILLKNSHSYLDPDLGWHLKVGQEISTSKMVPKSNLYNYSFTNNWVDHEWLIDVVSYQIYDNFSYLLLNVFFALIVISLLITLNIIIRKYFCLPSEIILAIFQLFGLWACLPSLGIRMQEFSLLFVLLELLILQKFYQDKSSYILAFLIPLFYFWANIHGSFLLGLGILFLFLIIKVFERITRRTTLNKYILNITQLDWRELGIFSFFIILVITVTLLTPYRQELYSFLGGYSNTAYLKLITEWLPLYTFPINYLQLVYLACLSGAWILYIYYIFYKKKAKLDLWQVSLSMIFLILAFKSKRNFPLTFVVTFPFFIKMLTSLFYQEKVRRQRFRTELKYLLITCMIMTSLNIYLNTSYISNPFEAFCDAYPCQALEFLRHEEQYKELNIFNEYDWGGYLIWQYSEKKIFIDGRLPQTNFAGQTFIEEYKDFFAPNVSREQKLETYNIQLVLLKTTDKKIKIHNWEKLFFNLKEPQKSSRNYFREHLERSVEWILIYQDPVASIYVKNN